MLKKMISMTVLALLSAAVSSVSAQDAVRIKCDRFTMNVPSPDVECFQIDGNIPAAENASSEDIANAQIANTAVYLTDYSFMSPDIAPQVIFYKIEDLGKVSFELMDTALVISDIMNNIRSGFSSVETVSSQIPFLPYRAETRLVNALPRQLDFENGSGIRTVTLFQDQISAEPSHSNLYYSFQGITMDGIYYISAVFPLQSALLNGKSAAGTDWNSLTEKDFHPSLEELDYYIRSITIE